MQATVILTVDVGFLAIPGVATDTNQNLRMSPAQVSSYLSIICSAGSIVMGLLLVRHHRTQEREKPGRAVSYSVSPLAFELTRGRLGGVHDDEHATVLWIGAFGNHLQRAIRVADVGVSSFSLVLM